ncbi:MAG: phage tail protein [Pseudomonadota bacterium]
MAAAAANNTPLNLAEMALAGDDVQPTGSETALPGELYRAVIGEQGRVDGSAHVAYFKMTVPEDGTDGKNYGPWTAWLWGLFDADGDLIVIGRFGNIMVKTDPNHSEKRALKLTIKVVFDNMDNVNLTFTPASDAVPKTRRIDTGFGLKGGGDFSEDRIHEVDKAALDGLYIPHIIDGRAQGDVNDPGLPDERYANLFPVPETGFIGQQAAITGAVDVEFRPLSGAGSIHLAFRLQVNSLEHGIVVYHIAGEFHDTGYLANVKIYSNNPSGAKKVRIYFDGSVEPVFHFYVGDITDVHTMGSVHCTLQSIVSNRPDAETKVNLGSLKPRYEAYGFVGNIILRIDVAEDTAFRRLIGSYFAARTNAGQGQGIPNETWTKVFTPIQVSDFGGVYNIAQTRFEPNKPGFYLLQWQINWLSGTPSEIPEFLSAVFKNGDAATSWQGSSSSASRYSGVTGGAAFIGMNGTTDFVDLFALSSKPDGSNGVITYASWAGFFFGV